MEDLGSDITECSAIKFSALGQDVYQGSTTRVKSKRGISEHVEGGIGLHQGSALSPFLFIMLVVVDTIYQDVRTELPWELLYAYDICDLMSVLSGPL